MKRNICMHNIIFVNQCKSRLLNCIKRISKQDICYLIFFSSPKYFKRIVLKLYQNLLVNFSFVLVRNLYNICHIFFHYYYYICLVFGYLFINLLLYLLIFIETIYNKKFLSYINIILTS